MAALLLGACAAQQPVSTSGRAVLPGSDVRVSGFLGDYSKLTPVQGQADTWQWARPGVDWRPYTKIFIPPVEVWINPEAAYPAIEPGLYKQMTDTFRNLTAAEFRAGGYEIVDKPGPNVLVLRYALTGVTPERPGLTPLDLLPVKIAVNAARAATGTDKTVIVVSGEVEAHDGATNERLFAEVAVRRDYHLFIGQQLTWDDLRNGATNWAKLSRQRLDRARGVQPG
jgi:uncharacterized protein DUF3313